MVYSHTCTVYYTLSAGTNADPRQCTPATAGAICHQHATCTQATPHVCACNPASSYRCECNQGYIGDGLNCTGESHLDIIENIDRPIYTVSGKNGPLQLLSITTLNRKVTDCKNILHAK